MTQNQSKSKLLYLLPLIIFIGVVAFLFTRLGESTQIEVNSTSDQAVPEFSLPNLQNPSQTLNATALPKMPYLLNVWGSWCIACSREHPLLVQLKEQGIDIVGVNYKDDPEFANKYLQDEGNPYVLNILDADGKLGINLGLTGAPETFVVDSDGIIRQHIVGEITEQIWQERIEPCFAAVKNIGSNVSNGNNISQVCQ